MNRIITSTIAAVGLLASSGLALAQSTPYSSDRSMTNSYSSDRSMTNRSYQPSYQDRQSYRSNRFSRTETAPTGQQGAGNQFASENEARARCGDSVVWVNTKTHVYHFPGTAPFGHTKHGAFMCEADAGRSGDFRPAKNEMRERMSNTGSSLPPRR